MRGYQGLGGGEHGELLLKGTEFLAVHQNNSLVVSRGLAQILTCCGLSLGTSMCPD